MIIVVVDLIDVVVSLILVVDHILDCYCCLSPSVVVDVIYVDYMLFVSYCRDCIRLYVVCI